MSRILVTGATGFIGNQVIPRLLQRGHEVIATSLTEERARRQNWYNDLLYIPFDLSTVDPAKDYYGFFRQPDLLIHLAWEGLPNYKSDFHIEENLPRHLGFIRNLVANGLKDITITGTCFEYGMQEGCLSEDSPSNPSNAYAIAKDRLRSLLAHLSVSEGFAFKWIRLFYMYGQGQSPNSLLSQLQLAIDRGDAAFNMSPGDQLRDYLPIEKVADHIISIATQKKVTGIVNCCSGKPIAVKQLVTDWLTQRKAQIELNLGYYPYSDIEPRNFWGDTKKLKTILTNE